MLQRFVIFMDNITKISKGIQVLKNRVMKQYGLNGGHAMYLFYLVQHSEGLTVSQMSELNKVSKPAVSRVFSCLYKKGYIDFPNYMGGKKYNTPAILTEKGRKQTKLLNDTICELVDKLSLTNVEEDDRTIMYRSLRTIANNITDYLNEEKA